MRLLHFIILSLLSFSYLGVYSQNVDPVEVIENKYHECLDKGQDMLNCSKVYYKQMDSLLNIYYQKLKITCNEMQVRNLKNEEIKWLAKRDSYFKTTLIKSRKNSRNGLVPRDDEMFMYDDNANFVKLRVIELSKKKNSEYGAK